MLAEMSPVELGDYLAEYRLSPWGEDRADLRSGIVASLIANVNRDAKKRPEPFSPMDFMPFQTRSGNELSSKIRGAFLARSK